MPSRPQDEPIDLSNDVGWCRSCGKRRVLCAFAMCVACHIGSERRENLHDQTGYLCCGWWKTGPLLEEWRCPTCGRVHGELRSDVASAPTGSETPLQIYAQLRLAVATLAREIEIVDYMDPPLAAPLEVSMRGLEDLMEQLGAALAHDARRSP